MPPAPRPFSPAGPARATAASLALLAFAQLIYSLDINIVFVALPRIGASLGFSDQTLQWVVSAYTVFCGGFLLLGGRAADLLGQRRMFLLALALYALSSLVGGLATTPAAIVTARAVQGIGAALLFPATLSLINRLFDEGPARNRALAVWGGAGASGLTLGSLAGGLLTSAFGWPAVFFVNVLLAAVALVAALVVIPPDPPRQPGRRFDLAGALTVTAGATLVVYALVQGPEDGWVARPIVAALVLAVGALAAFGWIESTSRDPLMPLRLFGNRSLVAAMAITFVYMGTFGALPYFLTVLFQRVQGLDAWQTGLAFVLPSLAILVGTQLGGRLVGRAGARASLIAGFATGIVGTLGLVPAIAADAGYAALVPGLVISGLGQGITWTAMWIAAASGVDRDEQGVASGMASTTLNVGNAIGIAVLVAYAQRGLAGVGAAGHARQASALAAGINDGLALAAVGMAIGLAIAFAVPRRGSAPAPASSPI